MEKIVPTVVDPAFLPADYMSWSPGKVLPGKESVDRSPDKHPSLPVPGAGSARFMFSLGPLYEKLGITFDLCEQFAADSGGSSAAQMGLETHLLTESVIHGLKDWGHLVQSWPDDLADAFSSFVLSSVFMWRPEEMSVKRQATVRRQDIFLPVGPFQVPLTVFLPRTAGRVAVLNQLDGRWHVAVREV
jgi:hypothetical protein